MCLTSSLAFDLKSHSLTINVSVLPHTVRSVDVCRVHIWCFVSLFITYIYFPASFLMPTFYFVIPLIFLQKKLLVFVFDRRYRCYQPITCLNVAAVMCSGCLINMTAVARLALLFAPWFGA